jgi:hypothetical protein
MKLRYILLAAVFVALVLYLIFSKPAPSNSLSDRQLLEYANSSFNSSEMMFKDFILGYHKGVPVEVSFPCSDVCPQYTMRIIRYNVSLSDCVSVGGEVKAIYVPIAIGVLPKEFCFPKVIVDAGVYNFAENRSSGGV